MGNVLTRIIGGKREWRAMETRARALPRDYRVVYDEMTSYLWQFATGDGMDVVALLREVLGLFETSAAEGRTVLDVTGEDVAAFCHELLRGVPSSVDARRAAFNRDVARKLAGRSSC